MSDPMSGIFRGFDIATTGLRAELQRSEIVASNLGNMHRTGNADNLPYRRKVVVFEEALQQAASKAAGGGASAGGNNAKKDASVDDRKGCFQVVLCMTNYEILSLPIAPAPTTATLGHEDEVIQKYSSPASIGQTLVQSR